MQAWQEYLLFKEKVLGKQTVEKWIRPLTVLRFDARNIYLQAKDLFQIKWLEEHFLPLAKKEFLSKNQMPIHIHLSLPEEKAPPPPTSLILSDPVDPLAKLSFFIPHSDNPIAVRLMEEITGYDRSQDSFTPPKPPLGTFNPIYLYGPSGCGKTHLLMGAHTAFLQNKIKSFYVTAQTFADHVVGAIRKGYMDQFRNTYRDIDVLIVDGVEIFSKKTATQEEFFHTFNTLHSQGAQIILSSRMHPKKLQDIEPRLVSRFEWGICVSLDLLGQNQMAQLLEIRQKFFHLPLSSKAGEFLLTHFSQNGNCLQKALQALSLRHQKDEELSQEDCQRYLADLLQEGEKPLTEERILEMVALHFGMTKKDILGKSQTKECAIPRQFAMYFFRTHLKLPFTSIGKLFLRDHSTVMSGVKQIQSGIENKNPETLNHIYQIELKLKEESLP